MSKDTQTVLALVAMERGRQDWKWGVQDHTPAEWMSILGEEYGEACEKVNETFQWQGGTAPIAVAAYVEELIQVAAVAVAAVENMERQYVEKSKLTVRPQPIEGLGKDHR